VPLVRTVSALYGALGVAAAYLLARCWFGRTSALIAAAAMAVTPHYAIHAGYVKEDVYLLPAVHLFLWQLIRLLEDPTKLRAGLLGVACGGAGSAKFVGILLFPIAVAALIASVPPGPRRKAAWRALGRAGLVAAALFLLVNAPLLARPVAFRNGLHGEWHHARTGRRRSMPPRATTPRSCRAPISRSSPKRRASPSSIRPCASWTSAATVNSWTNSPAGAVSRPSGCASTPAQDRARSRIGPWSWR